MKNPKISVIVPVFNAEKFLSRCIKSILSQKFSEFELLLVNDGSTDCSDKICEEFGAMDKRIQVFHKCNGGVSSARNMGLDNCKGEFIVFVDSDDEISSDYLGDLFSDLHSKGKGLVIQGFVRYNLTGEVEYSLFFEKDLLFQERFGLAFSKHFLHRYGGPVSKIFYADILRKNQIRFDEKIHLAEDKIFMLDYLKHVSYLKFSEKQNYRYLSNSLDSLTTKKYYEPQKYFFYQYLLRIRTLEKKFAIAPIFLSDVYNECAAVLFSRSIYPMYRPQFYIEKRARLKFFKEITNEELLLVKKKYFPLDNLEKISKYLLCHRFFRAFDFLNSMLFWIRYRLGFFWPFVRQLFFSNLVKNKKNTSF